MLFPKEMNKNVVIVVHTVVTVFLISVFVLPLNKMQIFDIVYGIFTLITLGFVMYILIKAIKNRRQGSLFSFIGLSFILGATILDFVSMLSILPAAAVVAIGEYLPIRHAAYYSCAGVAAGLIGWFFVRDVVDASHLYVIVPTGALAGFVYWLAAGRCAGKARGSR